MSQQNIKRVLHYDPITGVFVRRTDGSIWGYVSDRYIKGYVNGEHYSAHRLAFLYMEGVLPPDGVDHINHIPTDNSWDNLRHATQAINLRNKLRYSKNKSGISGVRWIADRKRWLSQIGVNGQTKKLGYFENFFDACCWRKSAELIYGYSVTNGR
jgi:hypothetical protein